VRWFLWAMLLLVALAGVSFLAAVDVTDRMEQDNRFCIACHLHEAISGTFHSVNGQVMTLAGSHNVWAATKCIDCHIGATIQDKVIMKTIAGRDTIAYLLGAYKEPEALRYPLGDRTCLKCHPDGGQNPQRADAFHNVPYHRDPRNQCSDCHRSHAEAPEEARFLPRETVKPLCDSCHMEVMGVRR